MTKTLRLLAADWQAGNKPEYYFGAELLSWLAPKNNNQKEVRLPIAHPDTTNLLKENVQISKRVLEEEQPEKIITLGGSCLVSQAPFDYLKGKYKDELGVIWIDAHPDISNPTIFHNEHTMVLGNLLGMGDPELSTIVENPLSSDSILYVGLQEPSFDEKDILADLNINYTIQQDKHLNYPEIQEWINQNKFKKIAIHFDLDVLDPTLFRSVYFAEPGKYNFPSGAGKLSISVVTYILTNLFENNEIVGLTIAEYLPWDAIKLKELMNKLKIFT
ncbi:arginase family protein [Enterococcus sp. PF-2]|uniref:arginase family protein n=1 Tax=unclassified Enterococcus TaxID=2608891 RepID=UPI00111E6C40|nr:MULTISPECIES: arginase family protein [unclassified Enterococcus]TPD98719.1 arginase family protein [Enterococcus sp. PF-3]TPE22880.1 arginase family protein [Enterococcus sp. PF-2]